MEAAREGGGKKGGGKKGGGKKGMLLADLKKNKKFKQREEQRKREEGTWDLDSAGHWVQNKNEVQETAAEKKSAKTKSKEQPAPAASSEGPGRGQQPVAASSSEGPRPTRGDVAATLVSQGAATSSAVTPAATEKPDLLAEMKKNKRFQEDDAPPDKDGGRSAKKKAKASARKEKAAAKEKASKIAAASAPPPRPSAAPEPVASLPGLFLESTPDVSETRKVPAKQRGPPFPPERRDDEDFDQRPSAASKEQSRPTSGSGSNAMAEKMKEYSATRSVRGVEQERAHGMKKQTHGLVNKTEPKERGGGPCPCC